MSELSEILKEEYLKEINSFNLKVLMEMIEDAVEQSHAAPITEESPDLTGLSDDKVTEMILKMIPDIEVSEIGWSDVRTPENAEEIKGPQRKLLEDYLQNIQGTDFEQKIRGVSQFYTDGAQMIERAAGTDRTKRIVQAISYLVFYKTLTKVITNFNASSAGFSFESFLAALVNGYQIPANTGTIADYVDRASGQEIPVSLKLYREGGLEVGGSYTDLVNDLVEPQYPGSIDGGMRYVVCTKSLSGKDLEQEGRIAFYQFDFNLNNVCDILAISKEKSQKCIMLPREVVSALQSGKQSGVDINDRLPGQANLPGPEELEKAFIGALDQILQAKNIPVAQSQAEDLLRALEYAKNDDIFKDYVAKKGDEERNFGVQRGRSPIDREEVARILQSLDWTAEIKTGDGKKLRKGALLTVINAANNAVIKQLSKTKLADERSNEIKRMVSEGEFLSPEESARQYKMMGARQKRIALKNSWGYLTTGHFSLNQKQATNPEAPTNTIDVGSIEVGRQRVSDVATSIRDLLNEEVAEIFYSLKILSDSLNSFFAGGLADDGLADKATDNAKNISSKEILKTKK